MRPYRSGPSPQSSRLSRFGRWFRVLLPVCVFAFIPVILVLAFWPTPHKYPWGIPLALVIALAFAVYRYRFQADDYGGILVVLVAMCALAAMTIAHWYALGPLAMILAGVALLVLPVIVLTMVLISAGAATDPSQEDG
jgi:hypothetical protein